MKDKCSDSKTGRTIAIHDHEAMLQTLTYYVETPEGWREAIERVKVEHALLPLSVIAKDLELDILD